MSDTPPAPVRERSLLWQTVVVVLLIAVTAVVEGLIEHTPVGRWLSYASHWYMLEGTSSSRPGVALVDISALRPSMVPGRTEPVTPRKEIQELLMAVVRQNPKAIAVDIDFSSDERGYVHPDDERFLDFCLRLHEVSGVPIVLGVGRRTGAQPPEWLGDPKYQALAATMMLRDEPRRVARSITVPGAAVPLRSISAALAQGYGSTGVDGFLRRAHKAMQSRGLIEQFSVAEIEGTKFEEFLVDYTVIDSFDAVSTPSAAGIDALPRRFAGKVVILGDGGDDVADRYTVREKSYPGMYIHASAAHTLMAQPLYEVTHKGRVILTVLLIGVVLLPVLAIRAYGRKSGKTLRIEKHYAGAMTFVLAVAGCVFSVVIVRATHVLWNGLFLALFALLLHWPAEQFFHLLRGLPTHVLEWLKEPEK